jgi:hypothetical protein
MIHLICVVLQKLNKMAKTSAFFYTEEQNKELKKLAAGNEKGTVIARRLSKQWKRPQAGIYCKISTLRKTGGKLKKESGMALPSGFSFDFKPTKAEMFKNHVRLYF